MINNLAKVSMKEYPSPAGNGESQVTGKSESINHGKLGKPVIPVLLTLLAGLGGGAFALKSVTVPSEPRDDGIEGPNSSANAATWSDAAALVEPMLSAKAFPAETASASPHVAVAAVSLAPNAKPVAMAAASVPEPALNTEHQQTNSGPMVEQLQVNQAPEIAAPSIAAPSIPAGAAPVIPPVKDAPGIGMTARPSVQAETAMASKIDVAAEPAATTMPFAPPVQPASAPAAQLAIADWNYSLPDPTAATDGNAFAAAASNAPITLVPSRAAPSSAGQPAASRTAGTRRQLAAPTSKVPATVGNRKIAGHGFASAINGRDKYQFVGSEIEFQLPVVANGAPVGDLTLHVAPNQQVSLRLRELLALFHDEIDPQVLTSLVASPSIDSFVTFDKLRDAGIEIRYDAARDRLALSVEQP